MYGGVAGEDGQPFPLCRFCQRFREARFRRTQDSGKKRLAPAGTVAIEFVFADFTAQGVAVNAKHLCGAALVAVRAFQHAPDETLFKFPNGFFKQYAFLDHLADEPFQLIFHESTLRKKNKEQVD
jgi:hypothetical protein